MRTLRRLILLFVAFHIDICFSDNERGGFLDGMSDTIYMALTTNKGNGTRDFRTDYCLIKNKKISFGGRNKKNKLMALGRLVTRGKLLRKVKHKGNGKVSGWAAKFAVGIAGADLWKPCRWKEPATKKVEIKIVVPQEQIYNFRKFSVYLLRGNECPNYDEDEFEIEDPDLSNKIVLGTMDPGKGKSYKKVTSKVDEIHKTFVTSSLFQRDIEEQTICVAFFCHGGRYEGCEAMISLFQVSDVGTHFSNPDKTVWAGTSPSDLYVLGFIWLDGLMTIVILFCSCQYCYDEMSDPIPDDEGVLLQ